MSASWLTARRVGLAVVDSDTAGSLARDATQAAATVSGVARAVRAGETLPRALEAAARARSELGRVPGTVPSPAPPAPLVTVNDDSASQS